MSWEAPWRTMGCVVESPIEHPVESHMARIPRNIRGTREISPGTSRDPVGYHGVPWEVPRDSVGYIPPRDPMACHGSPRRPTDTLTG